MDDGTPRPTFFIPAADARGTGVAASLHNEAAGGFLFASDAAGGRATASMPTVSVPDASTGVTRTTAGYRSTSIPTVPPSPARRFAGAAAGGTSNPR